MKTTSQARRRLGRLIARSLAERVLEGLRKPLDMPNVKMILIKGEVCSVSCFGFFKTGFCKRHTFWMKLRKTINFNDTSLSPVLWWARASLVAL